MEPTLDSQTVHSEIDQLLLSGQAQTAFEAEEIFLDAHSRRLGSIGIGVGVGRGVLQKARGGKIAFRPRQPAV